jgi:hypothetical protein
LLPMKPQPPVTRTGSMKTPSRNAEPVGIANDNPLRTISGTRRGSQENGCFRGFTMPELKLHIIYLRSGWLLVSKKEYPTWRQIQEEFADYMASFGPWPLSDVLKFLEDEYPTEYTPNDAERIKRFLDSKFETLALFH